MFSSPALLASPAARTIVSAAMAGPDRETLGRLALKTAERLTAGPKAAVTGDLSRLAETVARTVEANFIAEAGIEREARAKLASLGPASAGRDKDKLLVGIRQHLAKEKGFVL